MTFLSVKEHTLKKRKNRKDNENINGGGDDHNDNDNELPHSHNLPYSKQARQLQNDQLKHTRSEFVTTKYTYMYICGQKTNRNKKKIYTHLEQFSKRHTNTTQKTQPK